MEIISISKKHNNSRNRRKFEHSKDKFRHGYFIYYRDDEGKFGSRRISLAEFIKIKLFTKKINRKVEFFICDVCGNIQETKDICVNCQQ